MPVEFRDYYQILGVEKTAAQDELKKAFRKLARKYHPDVAENKDNAEDKFKEVNEAYEVLSDPEKRAKYDQLGQNWQQADAFAGQGSGDPGEDWEYHFDGTGFSDFFEHLFGQRSGGGGFGGFADYAGARSAGSNAPMRGRDIEAEIVVSLQEVLHGAERVLSLRRDNQGGGGEGDTMRVRIPKGVLQGQLIRCAGLGEPGFNGGERGDLFLRVVLQRHPDLTPDGSDLHCEFGIAPWKAVLGGKATINTPHGPVTIRIPEASEVGTQLRLRGKGLPTGNGDSLGDLYARIVVELPDPPLTSEQREAWENLRDLSQSSPT